MAKKSQFYIFAAVIFCSLFYLGTLNKLSVSDSMQNTEKLYLNYVTEGLNTLNSGLFNQQELSVIFRNYTDSFLDHSRAKGIRPGIIYFIILPDNSTIASNRMSSDATVITGVDDDPGTKRIFSLPGKIEKIINIGTNFTVELNESKYYFNVSSGETVELKVLFTKKE
ncbi:MAG: hypothetical protein V1859_03915 [archaeon]